MTHLKAVEYKATLGNDLENEKKVTLLASDLCVLTTLGEVLLVNIVKKLVRFLGCLLNSLFYMSLVSGVELINDRYQALIDFILRADAIDDLLAVIRQESILLRLLNVTF